MTTPTECHSWYGYQEIRRAEEGRLILNGGIEEEWDSYLQKMEDYGLSEYLAIKQKYFDQYQESLAEMNEDASAEAAAGN